jgi:hypothetical protein
MKQSELNKFIREHFDPYKKRLPGQIVHDPGTTDAHRRLVLEVCEWAHKKGLTFFTRVFLKKGKIVDVVIPELPYPFVEIRDSEKKKEKLYLDEYEKLTIFVDTDDPFKLT